MKTLQECFTISATHLLTQMRRSQIDSGMCAYRSEEGLMCGIGPLLTDAGYAEELEGLAVGTDELRHALQLCDVPVFEQDTLNVLTGLQSIHDFSDPSEWLVELKILADTAGLEMPEGYRHVRDESLPTTGAEL